MTGASGRADLETPRWRWHVALSFAGAQRNYVAEVAQGLKARGMRCFYDADEEIDLWGKYLPEELPAIYGEQAAVVVVFVSAEYAARDWTRLERRAALDRAVRERREYVLPARFDDTQLPGLLSGMITVDLRHRTPQQFTAMIADKLATLSLAAPLPAADMGSPVGEVVAPPPTGAVRASKADPRQLGLHAAISVAGVPDEIPPEYVPRDVDAAEFGVRARLATAARRGGFVLLVGGSSVGKTRTAVEAVTTLLSNWWLVHPAAPGDVVALAETPVHQAVIWLDDLQRYLGSEQGLTGPVVRALLNAPRPAVIIGTLWPDLYTAYTTPPVPGGTDPYAREREVLSLAAVVRIAPEFSPAEQNRARSAAARDPRLQVALDSAEYGLTQTLAAAPQLVARWEDAKTASPYAWAVLTAALDVARLGAHVPLSSGLLRAAAPGYCTSQQQAEAPQNWFEQALIYATHKLHGTVAALSPVGAGMGHVVGYTAADYLIQHASRERRYAIVPATTWDAVLLHVRDPTDTARLADSARSRLLYGYAIHLYRHAADAGNRSAALRLASLLSKRSDVDGLRVRADTGDVDAARLLAQLLAERGDLDGLRVRADSGDRYAAGRLADLLAESGDLDGLRAQADAGDLYAAGRLADLMAERGDLDGLRVRADSGDRYAAERLADLLAQRGEIDAAAQILRARADTGDVDAARLLAQLLAERGDLDGLRVRANNADRNAARLLAGLLAKRGDLDELHARATSGDPYAAGQLVDLLTVGGDLDGLRAEADNGDRIAAGRLADLLAERGNVDEAAQVLRSRADDGDRVAALRLADLLVESGDLDEAAHMLRTRADEGDREATERLADLLAERGDLDGLRARAATGDRDAAGRLADLLAERGDLDGLRARADVGDPTAALLLADLLAERGDLDGLRARAAVGDAAASSQLTTLLIKQGRGEEAERLYRYGLNPDGSIARADVDNRQDLPQSLQARQLTYRSHRHDTQKDYLKET